MSELVLLRHNEPMTTSLAIAACTENEHDSVILLVRKFIDDLEEFGDVNFQTAKPGNSRFEIGNRVFEIENCRSEKGRKTEFAFLNEQQATLLITFMRNSEIVRRFKIALVKSFYEMRDHLRGASQPQFITSNMAHGADLAVSADRTFRSFLRSARAAGLRLPLALRQANAQTIQRTGMDMLKELGVEDAPVSGVHDADTPADRVRVFAEAWLAGELRYPCTICKSTDFYDAYLAWSKENGGSPLPPPAFFPVIKRTGLGIDKRTLSVYFNGDEEKKVRAVVPPGSRENDARCAGEFKGMFYAREMARFEKSLRSGGNTVVSSGSSDPIQFEPGARRHIVK